MKRISIILVLLLTAWAVQAQESYNSSGKVHGYRHKKKEGLDPDKVIIGGGLNLGYYNDYANFGISPKLGYRVTDFLGVGVGVGYQYYKYPDLQINNNIYYSNQHLIYPSLWAKCKVYDPFYVAADFEMNYVMLRYSDVGYDVNGMQYVVKKNLTATAPVGLIGVGMKQPVVGRFSVNVEIMYDVIQSEYSPYLKTLAYRFGIYAGLP